jgi:HPt (histidine-containing phosphotransfer) domain-containing protein
MGAAPAMTYSPATAQRPVDLAHLARQTMGNRELEREVLHLFVRQAEMVLQGLGTPGADRATLAHTLLGAARGIGAHRVATAAARLEAVARSDRSAGEEEAETLRNAALEANLYIRSLVTG